MATTPPPSLTTLLRQIYAAGRKLATFSSVQSLLRSILGLPVAVVVAFIVMFCAWSCEHQARMRDTAEAKQVKKQAAEDISRLEQQAAGALQAAKQSAQAVGELETKRQALEREAEGLRQSLALLQKQELASAGEVATLPTSEVVSRVASRLQEPAPGVRDHGAGQQSPSPQTPAAGSGEKQPAAGVKSDVPNLPGPSGPTLVLSDQGVRKVETALVELDSCRQQVQVLGQQVSNFERQSKLNSAIIDQQSSTIAKLNSALADKDQILARTQSADRAELKAARGTWQSRLARAAEFFAGGFVAGMLVR